MYFILICNSYKKGDNVNMKNNVYQSGLEYYYSQSIIGLV